MAEAFPSVHVNPRRFLMEKEQAAYENMLPELLKNFESQYVAVHNGQVIDHDSDKLALIARIDQSLANEIVLVKQVTHALEQQSEAIIGRDTLNQLKVVLDGLSSTLTISQ